MLGVSGHDPRLAREYENAASVFSVGYVGPRPHFHSKSAIIGLSSIATIQEYTVDPRRLTAIPDRLHLWRRPLQSVAVG